MYSIRKLLHLVAVLSALAPAAARADCQFGVLAKLPVTMRGIRASIPVSIKGEKSDMWLDTGAFFNFMSRAKAAQLGLRLDPLPDGFRISGIGGSAEAQLTRVTDLELAGIHIDRMEFIVGGSDAGNSMLGANMFYQFDSEFDIANGRINLMQAKGCGKANLAYWAGDRFIGVAELADGEHENDRHIYAPVTINGVRLVAMLDTGAPTSVVTRRAAQRAGVDLKSASDNGQAYGIGTKGRQTWVAQLKSFEIGDETISNTPITVIDEEIGHEDVILGMDFFLSHHLLVARSQKRLYLTYNGGPIFSLGTEHITGKWQMREENMGGADKAAAPVDAAGFAGRGTARLAQHDYDGAIADLSEAIRQKPVQGEYLRDRARAYAAKGQTDLAHKDQEAAMRLLPDDPKLLATRAVQLAYTRTDEAQALADKALALAPKGSLDNRVLVEALERLHRPDQAIALLDAIIALHREDSRLGSLLNDRCWLRGLANKDLDKAARDCEAASRSGGSKLGYYGSRGLIRLRQKDFAGALTDFDAALANGGGAIERALHALALIGGGEQAKGEAELDTARKASPWLTGYLAGYGLGAGAVP